MLAHRLAALGALLTFATLSCVREPAARPARQGSVAKVASLGASTRAPSKAEIEDLGLEVQIRARGQVVTTVEAGGAAALAGVGAGDVLLRMGGVDLYSQDDVFDIVGVSSPGQEVEAIVLRAKTKKLETVVVRFGTREASVPDVPRLEWEFASLAQLGEAVARARKEGKVVLVGLSGAET